MKVWIGYYCYYNLCDTWETVERVFDDEVKALLWTEDPEFALTVQKWNDNEALEWRRYEGREVE
jgi:hypothetical protein